MQIGVSLSWRADSLFVYVEDSERRSLAFLAKKFTLDAAQRHAALQALVAKSCAAKFFLEDTLDRVQELSSWKFKTIACI